MRILDLIHRWTGGLVGLLLAIIGLSGALLMHKTAWLLLPHSDDALVHNMRSVGATVSRLMADPAHRPEQIRFASQNFGLHQLTYADGSGAYTDQTGNAVSQWASQWSRPELWLFDLHHHLFAGHAGEIITGLLGVIGIGFVVTGIILWWRLRKTFEFRIWPARMTRPAIVRQHRDLGIVIAPLLLLSFLTGAMMDLKPLSDALLSPWSSPAEMSAAMATPTRKGGALAARLDWNAMLAQAHRRYPDAEFRVLLLPAKPGDLIMLRMRRPDEWLPNGRTACWFAPESGQLVAMRDGLALPPGNRIYNMLYSFHAATIGGLPYRLVMTVSGLGLTLMGTLAVWSFWFRRNHKPKRPPPKAAAA